MLGQAREVYILADSTELGDSYSSFWRLFPEKWTLLTDSSATDAQPVTAPLLHRKPPASLPIPHMVNLALNVPNASNGLVVGQNTSFFCLLYRPRSILFANPLG